MKRFSESTYSQVSKALCGKENATLDEILDAVDQLTARIEGLEFGLQLEKQRTEETVAILKETQEQLAQVEREKEAAVRDLEDAVDGHCRYCKNNDLESQCDYTGECHVCLNEDCPCHERNCHWQWRGVCPENTKEETE